MQGKKYWLGLVLILAGITALVTWAISRQQSRTTLRMPDGSLLVIRSATYGKSHLYRYGKLVPRLAAPLLSNKLKSRFGVMEYSRTTEEPCLILWGQWSGLGTNQYPPNVITFVDSNGVESEMVWGLGLPNSNSKEAYVSWKVLNYPRREKTLRLKIYQSDARGHLMHRGGLEVANPEQGPFPTWERPAGPAAQAAAGCEFKLVSLVVDGVPVPGPNPRRPDLLPGHTVAFQAHRNGEPAPEWQTVKVQLQDATGNVLNPARTAASVVGAFTLFHFTGALWPDEKVWKVKAEFIRTSQFTPEEILTISNVPIARVNQSVSVTNATAVEGRTSVVLTLQKFLPFPQIGTLPMQNGNVLLKFEGAAPKRWVSLQKVYDQDGRSIPFVNQPYSLAGWPAALQLPPESRVLRFEFAIQQPVALEFLSGVQQKPGARAGVR